MEEFLNITEVARLMNMSPSQIRFYERKKLIMPARQPNGYRRYSFAEIDRLEVISLLKDMRVPIGDIRNSLDIDKASYQDLLAKSERLLEKEMENLQKKLDRIKKIRISFFDYTNAQVVTDWQEAKSLAVISRGGYAELTERKIYRFIEENEYEYVSSSLIFYVVEKENGERFFCAYNKQKEIPNKASGTIELPEGRYASLKVVITRLEEADDKVRVFERGCERMGLRLAGDMIAYYSLEEQIFTKHGIYLVLQKRVAA